MPCKGELINLTRNTIHCQMRDCTYNVLEAKFVSSCLSLPSRAKPRFSRLFTRKGVRVYTLQNVELGATKSLEHDTKQRAIIQMSTCVLIR